MLKDSELEALRRIAKGVAAQFGTHCEVVVHEISARSTNHSIVAIENGHVSGRKPGDGPSQVVLEQLSTGQARPDDHLCYLTRTPDGRLLKSTSVYIPDSKGKIAAIFGINYDISNLVLAEQSLHNLTSAIAPDEAPANIPRNVNDLLEDLIVQADRLIGKPVEVMTKEDKVRAIRFLDDHGAMLITKSGDKIAAHFGISKYTLYSYLDVKKQEEKTND